MRFDACSHYGEFASQTISDGPEVRVVGKGSQESSPSFYDCPRPGEAQPCKVCRCHSVARCPSSSVPLCPRAIFQELEEPGRRTPRDTECVLHLRDIKTEQSARGRCCCKRSARCRRVEASIIM